MISKGSCDTERVSSSKNENSKLWLKYNFHIGYITFSMQKQEIVELCIICFIIFMKTKMLPSVWNVLITHKILLQTHKYGTGLCQSAQPINCVLILVCSGWCQWSFGWYTALLGASLSSTLHDWCRVLFSFYCSSMLTLSPDSSL